MMRKTTRCKASMSLDWKDTGDGSAYEAQLPEIPGYPGTWYATVAEDENEPWDDDEYSEPDYTWYFTIARKDVAGIQGVSILNNYVFGLDEADSPEELQDFIENLTPQDIADKFAEQGYAPATASRHATRRVASLDLDWEETTDTFGEPLYTAVLPAIPGYPYSGDGNSTVSIGVDGFDSTDETYIWWMDIQVGKNDNVSFTGYELTGMGSYPLDYQMGYLDGLSVEWIADKLAEKGYPPEED